MAYPFVGRRFDGLRGGHPEYLATCEANLRRIAYALNVFNQYADGGPQGKKPGRGAGYPNDWGVLMPYLKTAGFSSAPLCPVRGPSYVIENHSLGFKVFCRGKHHVAAGIGRNQPVVQGP